MINKAHGIKMRKKRIEGSNVLFTFWISFTERKLNASSIVLVAEISLQIVVIDTSHSVYKEVTMEMLSYLYLVVKTGFPRESNYL
jgi:hypothetical protein